MLNKWSFWKGDKMEKQRLSITKIGKRRVGLVENNEILTIETYADNLALDIVEELIAIRQGEKTRDSTTIDLDIKVLNSLSGAIRALKQSTVCS